MDCGAYKKFHPEIKTEADEIELHKQHMKMAKEKIKHTFPDYGFRGFLMDLEGKCKEIDVDTNESQHVPVSSQRELSG